MLNCQLFEIAYSRCGTCWGDRPGQSDHSPIDQP